MVFMGSKRIKSKEKKMELENRLYGVEQIIGKYYFHFRIWTGNYQRLLNEEEISNVIDELERILIEIYQVKHTKNIKYRVKEYINILNTTKFRKKLEEDLNILKNFF